MAGRSGFFKFLRRASFVSVGVASVAAGGLYINDPAIFENLERPYTFWSKMFPIYAKYRYLQWKLAKTPEEEANAIWDKVHEEYAPKVLDIFLELKGIYIKVGQVMASRSDICPEIYRNHFKVLLDRVPSMPGPQARQIIETALGAPIDALFVEFDDVALGSASIGQVRFLLIIDAVKYFL